MEEPVGLVRLHHARSEAMPDHGADHRLGLQLVDDLHAFGNPGQTRRSHHLAAVGLTRHRPADPSWKSDHGGDYEHACEGFADGGNLDEGERVSQANQGDCGAVDAKGAMEADSQRRVSPIPWWQGHRKRWPARRRPRLMPFLGSKAATAIRRTTRWLQSHAGFG